jgi:hypothetical protein
MLAVLYAWILLTTDSFMKEHGFTDQHLTQRDIRDVGGTIALQMEGQGSVLMCPWKVVEGGSIRADPSNANSTGTGMDCVGCRRFGKPLLSAPELAA